MIPVFNRRDELVSCVRSVTDQQSWAVQEIIVVDDASSDGSAEVAAELGCNVVRLGENSGAATARNAGLERVTASWVCFLDSDDVWHPNLLATLRGKLDTHALVSGTGLLTVDGRVLTLLGTTQLPGQELRTPVDLLVPANPVVTSATLVRTEIVREVGGFDEQLRYSEDLDLWLRVLERGSGWCDATPVLTYHRGSGSKSQQAHGRVESVRATIAGRYAGRTWWTPSVNERYLGGMYWEGARSALRGHQRAAAARHLVRAAAHPRRIQGVVESVARNRRLRRRAAAL